MIFQTTIASVTKTPLSLVGNDILPDTSGNSNIGSSVFRYSTVYANQFDGIASQADSLTVGGIARTSSTAQTAPNTIAVRDSSSFLWAVEFKGVASSAQYADLAEKYVADADYAPGTVLMFGGDKEVTECAHDMCSRVAGVVSTTPAYLMNSGLEGEHTVELALTGRVPTKVRGPILKGDLIVSAGDGHARAEGLPQVGTVIGKALEDFNGDTGVIEVVVGKH